APAAPMKDAWWGSSAEQQAYGGGGAPDGEPMLPGGDGGAGDAVANLAPGIEPTDKWLDFDRLVMAGAEDNIRRGHLIQRGDRAGQRIEGLSPAGGLSDPQHSRGRFDHRYDADGVVVVPSDGQTHRVSLGSAETTPQLHMLTVPRERPEVYREAELKNPCEA